MSIIPSISFSEDNCKDNSLGNLIGKWQSKDSIADYREDGKVTQEMNHPTLGSFSFTSIYTISGKDSIEIGQQDKSANYRFCITGDTLNIKGVNSQGKSIDLTYSRISTKQGNCASSSEAVNAALRESARMFCQNPSTECKEFAVGCCSRYSLTAADRANDVTEQACVFIKWITRSRLGGEWGKWENGDRNFNVTCEKGKCKADYRMSLGPCCKE
jgi:hypothetical protein